MKNYKNVYKRLLQLSINR